MKLRSLLLVSCMLVVPALAMFSHWIPNEFRAATRRVFAAATSGWLGTPAEAGTVPTAPTTPAPAQPATSGYPAAAAGLMPAATAPSATVPSTTAPGLAPAATGLPPAAAGAPVASASLLPVGTPPAAAAEPAAPPLVAQLADRTRQARDQQGIEAQLKSAGAVSFDCQPLPGSEGLYSSSCRVPVDATGQLQRVFQASGQDPGSASAALLEQVMAWRQRAATQPPPTAAGETGGTGSRSGGRFR